MSEPGPKGADAWFQPFLLFDQEHIYNSNYKPHDEDTGHERGEALAKWKDVGLHVEYAGGNGDGREELRRLWYEFTAAEAVQRRRCLL